jgi:hypothetical protein
MRNAFFTAAVMLCIATAAAERDWGQTAVDDLHFIRAVVRENHPGPIDSENAALHDWYRRGLDQATNFAGYFFSINYYMAGFHHGHLGALS